MFRLNMVLLLGALIGALLTYFLLVPGTVPPANEVVRDIVVVEKMTAAAAEQHRKKGYYALHSVEAVYALPGEFARSEALYALAGRSESSAVQSFIFEANRIASAEDRAAFLNILFFRFTELDPQSALALSRTDALRGDRNLERRVWVSWARRDLDEALSFAQNQTTQLARNFATQSLYRAYGDMGNATTDRIEAVMGIEPDRTTRSRFIYDLADESPAKAIEYINEMDAGTNQEELVTWLAHYIAPRQPERAGSYASLFDSTLYQETYRRIVSYQIASAKPAEIIDRLVSGNRSGLSQSQIYSAIRGIAKEDTEVAMAYYEQLRSAEDKRFLINAISRELVARDVDEALAWARRNDTGSTRNFETQVLQELAQRDLARAIQEVQNMPDAGVRAQTLASVIQMAAQRNPEEAIAHMNLIKNPNMRDDAAHQAIRSWMRKDATAAVDWLLNQDADTVGEYLTSPTSVVHADLDAAIRLLAVVSEENQQNWRYQIATRIASSRSASEAMSFARQFEGQPGHGGLQTAIIAGVAQSDIYTAQQMADQMAEGEHRDATYTQLIQTHSATNPQEALAWLGNIEGERYRGLAAASVVAPWYARDPVAAQNWADDLPSGLVRDDAIAGLAAQWREYGPAEQALINSISDADKRNQAVMRHIYSTLHRNPARARELLEQSSLPNSERIRVEDMLRRVQRGY